MPELRKLYLEIMLIIGEISEDEIKKISLGIKIS